MKCEMVVIYYYPEFSAKGIPGLVRTGLVPGRTDCQVFGDGEEGGGAEVATREA